MGAVGGCYGGCCGVGVQGLGGCLHCGVSRASPCTPQDTPQGCFAGKLRHEGAMDGCVAPSQLGGGTEGTRAAPPCSCLPSHPPVPRISDSAG